MRGVSELLKALGGEHTTVLKLCESMALQMALLIGEEVFPL